MPRDDNMYFSPREDYETEMILREPTLSHRVQSFYMMAFVFDLTAHAARDRIFL